MGEVDVKARCDNMEKNYKEEIARQVLRVRLSQLIINEKYRNGEFKVPIHLAMGHEAIAVAVDFIMADSDQLVLSHRNIQYNLARVRSLKPEIDEYVPNEKGLAGGQLGSMNLANEERAIMYSSSILGNNLPVSAGLALGKKVKGQEGITIVETGDGAMEEGTFYETLVFLKSNNLSVIVIIENNGWSLATRIKERRCEIDVKKFVESMNIEYDKFDSNDTFEYIEKLKKCRGEVLREKTPMCLEVKLTTLGHWCKKTDEYPGGKFINYHSGPSPSVHLGNGPLIEESDNDPVFVLHKYFRKQDLEEISQEILNSLKEEIS